MTCLQLAPPCNCGSIRLLFTADRRHLSLRPPHPGRATPEGSMSAMLFDEVQRLKTAWARVAANLPPEWRDCGEVQGMVQAIRAVTDTIAEAWPPPQPAPMSGESPVAITIDFSGIG